jgi:hypothetical protein
VMLPWVPFHLEHCRCSPSSRVPPAEIVRTKYKIKWL